MFRVLWTLLSLASAFPILGIAIGSAAWSGVNFVVAVYLFLSIGGFVGLLAGLCVAFSPNRPFAWVTSISAAAITAVSAIFAYGFVFDRAREVPWNNPIFIGGFHTPILSLYGIALVCCSIEALLYFPGAKRIKAK